MTNVPADVNCIQLRRRLESDIFVRLYRQHSSRCDASQGEPFQPFQTRQFSSPFLIHHLALPLGSSRATVYAPLEDYRRYRVNRGKRS